MGRRSQHTAEELRQLILEAAQKIVEKGGVNELSAREIAREIGYAPGTLYNLFRNLDDILLRVEADLFGELEKTVVNAMEGKKPAEAIRRFAAAYAEFAFANAKLWGLIQERHPVGGAAGPDWYLEKVHAPAACLEKEIGRLTGNRDVEEVARQARVLWSGVHGVVQVATTAKFGSLPQATAIAMAESLAKSFVEGLVSSQASGDERSRNTRAASSR